MPLHALVGALRLVILAWAALAFAPLHAQEQAPPPEIVFADVRVFDGTSKTLSQRVDVLVRGNVIAAIGQDVAQPGPGTIVIEGRGRTLMPGLIDNHVHMMFNSLSPAQMLEPDMGLEKVMQLSAGQARAMLLRGF
ncbi:MAG: hypothetical protein RIC51_05990, partial [Erythrobacter sp.]